MGLCSDSSWKRMQERRAVRAAALASARADRARMSERLADLSSVYRDRDVARAAGERED